MLNTTDTVKALKDVPLNSVLFVSYVPGRKPSTRAYQEAQRAIEVEGISPRHFTGRLHSAHMTRKGEFVFTLWVEERDSTQDGKVVHGAYRAFNPALGTLLTLQVLEKA